jgi:DNA polymerase bacteriophage-type
VRFVVADWETRFSSKDYTLSKMTTESYIRDPRFKAHGVAIKWSPDTLPKWYNEDQARYILAQEDWSDTFLIHHHANFDSLIESHHYNVHPKMIGCTLAMARLMLGNHLSVSLEQVRRHFGMPGKITPYSAFDGKKWEELSYAVQQQMAEGACDEVESIWIIFNKLMAMGFPKEELYVVDATVKMFSEPMLRGDVDLLARVWETENDAKALRLKELAIDASELQSSDKFAALLRAEGVEPATKDGKVDPATGRPREIYAFAKTDQFMRDLLEDDSPRVRTLAEARLGEKSTLLQTRAETLGWMARRGPMPVYLRYAGAHTTRWSGGDGANWQNFKRGSDIRRAIMAPEGSLLAPIDLAQIECRILCYLAGQEDYIEKFRQGEDPYVGMASKAYGYAVTKDMPKERGTGKQLVLSCGYMAGDATIQKTAALGIYGPAVKISLTTAGDWKHAYRQEFDMVVTYWAEAGNMLPRLAHDETCQWGPMLIRDKQIFGPGGTMLHYETLQWYVDPESGDRYWRYRTRHGWTKLYSGKLVENVVQWLARIVMSQAMLRIVKRGYRVLNTTHDELLILLANDGQQEYHLQECIKEFEKTPEWLPGIPLAAEGSIGIRYSK